MDFRSSQSDLGMLPKSTVTSAVTLIAVTPLLSFGLVMASVVIYNGTTTWIVIFAALVFGKVASFGLAVADNRVLADRWQIGGPTPWWNLGSPAIYLSLRGRVTSAHEWGAFRPLWRWCAATAVVIFAVVQLSFWGGALLKLHDLATLP